MSLLAGFPPLANAAARALILGSMPGAASLAAGEYYAHPRNAFWPIMGDLLGAGPALPYPQRLARLQAAGLALWDVIGACRRPGSLDADIEAASVQVNDFIALFERCPAIGHVLCNGATAEIAFRRRVLPLLGGRNPVVHRLPSTSPAHAARHYAEKRAAWATALRAASIVA